MAVRKGKPFYVELANKKLDFMFPVWNIKARSSFLPREYENLTRYHVSFAIVKVDKYNQKEIFKGPWSAPVVPNSYSVQIGTYQVDHIFVLSDEDDYNVHEDYQLEISTNLDEPVSLSFDVSGFSELSLDGIVLAAAVLIFLYILIIFEIVQRTLAAMIGATAAITCLTLIRDVSTFILNPLT